ncbi:MAG: hypothetical protein OER43_00045 [Gammaproteobacteria bacterium]|nr:hypothetical protein [Gammaproteobacteria bacterium]
MPARSTREEKENVIGLVHKNGESRPREAELVATALSGSGDIGDFCPPFSATRLTKMVVSRYTRIYYTFVMPHWSYAMVADLSHNGREMDVTTTTTGGCQLNLIFLAGSLLIFSATSQATI